MPRMEQCQADNTCSGNSAILCKHRFEFCSLVFYCNSSRFKRASDLDIVLYFLKNFTRNSIFAQITDPYKIIIVTKDLKFLQAVKREWDKEKQKLPAFYLDFNSRSIVEQRSGIEIFIQDIACKAYGTKADENRRCAIESLNKFVNAQ